MKFVVLCTLVLFWCELTMGNHLLKTHGNRVPGSFIIILKSSEDSAVDKVEERLNTTTKAHIKGVIKGKGKLKGMIVHIDAEDVDSLDLLLEDPDIDYIEEDSVVTPVAENWGLDEIDMIPGNGVYDCPGDGSGKTVYVVDSGTYGGHKDWEKNLKPEELSDQVDGRSRVSDCYGHGTHVAGIVSSPSYGVAKKAQISGVRVLDCNGYGSWGQVIRGLNDIINIGIPKSVINLSLAGPYSQSVTDTLSDTDYAGFLIVVAAGNSNIDGCTVTPANSTHVIAVGAINADYSRWAGSNFGPCVDLYAPGSYIDSLGNSNPTSYTTKTGTSMASPHVAGIAAVLWGLNPGFTNDQIRNLILASATADVVTGLDPTSNNLLARLL